MNDVLQDFQEKYISSANAISYLFKMRFTNCAQSIPKSEGLGKKVLLCLSPEGTGWHPISAN
jgi:hypothetical protein